MFMKIRIIFLLLSVFPLSAFASGNTAANTIQADQVDSTDQIVVVTGASVWTNPDACTNSGYVIVQGTNSWFKDLLAAALAAQVAAKTVIASVSGCYALPWGGTAPIAVALSISG
jgi:hypothetical protein